MVQTPDQVIECRQCGFSTQRGNVERQCSNCFACTGCEIYLCPECGNEIVIRSVRKPGNNFEKSVS
jgi:hypothetical protein